MRIASGLVALGIGSPAFAGQDLVVGGLDGPEETTFPIINGDPADDDDYPMTGGFIADATNGTFRQVVCSSTLIAPDVVLLAAHCVDPVVLGSYGFGSDFVWSREPDLSSFDGSGFPPLPGDAVVVRATTRHAEWDIEGLEMGLALNDDIALAFLDEPVLDVPLAYLPTEDEAQSIAEGVAVAIVGWGQIAQDGPAGKKYWGRSSVGQVAAYEFQVGPAETDVRQCHGDSGGPTFLEVETDSNVKERVVGVVSHTWDQSDCLQSGGVETRVDFYLEWIQDEMSDACGQGVRAWCEETGILAAPLTTDLSRDDLRSLRDDIHLQGCSVLPPRSSRILWLLGVLVIRRARRRVPR